MAVPRFLVLLADAYGQAGQVDEGFVCRPRRSPQCSAIATAVRRPRTFTASGEICCLPPPPSIRRGRSKFAPRVDIARGQQAKSPELRATMSLARLLDKRGDRKEARAMLAAIYGWFTEGFDTADLKAAKTLLEELSA